MSLRDDVIKEAISWVGTPYHHHGRVKGVGVDCAMLLAEVYARTGVLPAIDAGHYPTDWHLHRSEELFLAQIKLAGGVPVDPPAPGDVAMFRYGRTVSHGAIVIQWPVVVHSYIGQGVVYDDADNGPLRCRFAGAWSVIHGR